MERFFDKGWEITPAGGATGAAFFARHKKEKLFLKRNSSPFLAVLSAEGIVPKLVWTKRLESGDVITAQQWLNGRELTPKEMAEKEVAQLLQKIHYSEPLLSMLKRLGKTPLFPDVLMRKLRRETANELLELAVIKRAFAYLDEWMPTILLDEMVVCHCDVNHNNWLLSETNKLYLIDWDGAAVADSAIDLGPLLYWYVERDMWDEWLDNYGITLNDELELKMKWYVVLQTVEFVSWHEQQGRLEEMYYWLNYLETIFPTQEEN